MLGKHRQRKWWEFPKWNVDHFFIFEKYVCEHHGNLDRKRIGYDCKGQYQRPLSFHNVQKKLQIRTKEQRWPVKRPAHTSNAKEEGN